MQQVSFADSAANFTDLSDFEVRIRTSSILQTASIAKAGLWIKLANLGNGQVYYRTGRAFSGTTSPVLNGQRALIDKTLFSNPTVYVEGVASSSSATGTTFSLFDAGVSDSATAGTNVASSGLIWGTTKSRQRSSALNTISGDRFFGSLSTSAGQTSNVTNQTVIIQFHY